MTQTDTTVTGSPGNNTIDCGGTNPGKTINGSDGGTLSLAVNPVGYACAFVLVPSNRQRLPAARNVCTDQGGQFAVLPLALGYTSASASGRADYQVPNDSVIGGKRHTAPFT